MRGAQRLEQQQHLAYVLTVSSTEVYPCHDQWLKEAKDLIFEGSIRQTTKPQNARTGRTGRPAGQVTDKHALRMKSCAADKPASDKGPEGGMDLLLRAPGAQTHKCNTKSVSAPMIQCIMVHDT